MAESALLRWRCRNSPRRPKPYSLHALIFHPWQHAGLIVLAHSWWLTTSTVALPSTPAPARKVLSYSLQNLFFHNIFSILPLTLFTLYINPFHSFLHQHLSCSFLPLFLLSRLQLRILCHGPISSRFISKHSACPEEEMTCQNKSNSSSTP
jgi:hypothetical protein